MSNKVLAYFQCQNIDGIDYLIPDMSIRCTDKKYLSFLPWALAMTGVYPIGVPAFLFWLLFRNRTRLQRPQIILAIGFLYGSFIVAAFSSSLCSSSWLVCRGVQRQALVVRADRYGAQ